MRPNDSQSPQTNILDFFDPKHRFRFGVWSVDRLTAAKSFQISGDPAVRPQHNAE
jgi:hypothetical protein